MNSGSTQFVPSARLGFCKPIHEIAMWDEFKTNGSLDSPPPIILETDAKSETQCSEDTNSQGKQGASSLQQYENQDPPKPDKVLRSFHATKMNLLMGFIDGFEAFQVLRRQAQNREAARKSRLRKKVYVQQLEKCKEKLLEFERARRLAREQSMYVDGGALDGARIGAYHGTVNQSVATFEMEYGRWVEKQNRLVSDMRNALHVNTGDMELAVLVENGLRHHYNLFSMKASAVKADAFHVVSGLWRTPAERLFFWIGGFRPSEVLKVVSPNLEPLSEQQQFDIGVLRLSCEQAEDALTQGMERLHQIVSETIAGEGNYDRRIGAAIEKLQGLIVFLGQADHLRRETLEQISRILSPRQAARGLLALGDYIQCLQALSLAWSNRHIT